MAVRRLVATFSIVSVSALGLTAGSLAPAGAAACYTGTW